MAYQKSKLGQVFLKNPATAKKIVDLAAVPQKEAIIEVGCGEGVLSRYLAEQYDQFGIVELDADWLSHAQDVLSDFSHIQWIHSDVLALKPDHFAFSEFHIISNLPYYISAKFIQWMVGVGPKLKTATVMFQKEFGDKLMAKPGSKDYTSLSVFTQFNFKVEALLFVGKGQFHPVPKVDSIVLKLTPITDSPFERSDLLFKVVNQLFWARRKTILNCLRNGPYLMLDSLFQQDANIQPFLSKRGETLDLESFSCLTNFLKPYVKEISNG